MFYVQDVILGDMQGLRLGDVAVFENRQPVTAAEFILKMKITTNSQIDNVELELLLILICS
jgi:hypothetical protein